MATATSKHAREVWLSDSSSNQISMATKIPFATRRMPFNSYGQRLVLEDPGSEIDSRDQAYEPEVVLLRSYSRQDHGTVAVKLAT